MSEEQHKVDQLKNYRATADAILELARRGQDAVVNGDHAQAAMVYSLVNEFSKAIAIDGSVHFSNGLRREILPQEIFEEVNGKRPIADPDRGLYL